MTVNRTPLFLTQIPAQFIKARTWSLGPLTINRTPLFLTQIPAQFIKARTWSLGPLTIAHPVMMTMDLRGLVRGGPGPVIGIVGYDIFRRAVVELPQMLGLGTAALGAGPAGQGRGAALAVMAATVSQVRVGDPSHPVPYGNRSCSHGLEGMALSVPPKLSL